MCIWVGGEGNLAAARHRRLDASLGNRGQPREVRTFVGFEDRLFVEEEMTRLWSPRGHLSDEGDSCRDLVGFDVDLVGVQVTDETIWAHLYVAGIGGCRECISELRGLCLDMSTVSLVIDDGGEWRHRTIGFNTVLRVEGDHQLGAVS